MNENGFGLPSSFYARPTLDVLEDLIGKVLVHEIRGRRAAGIIVEAEAYIGPPKSLVECSDRAIVLSFGENFRVPAPSSGNAEPRTQLDREGP